MKDRKVRASAWLWLGLVGGLWVVGSSPALAQDGQEAQASADAEAVEVAEPASAEEPGVDEVLQRLMRRRVTDPPAASAAQPGIGEVGPGDALPEAPVVPVPPAAVEIDPAVLGVAPGEPMPTLRREGEFLINRRGRLLRSPEGYQLFVFEADGQEKPELPMIVQPTRLLEAMEELVNERGDAVVFIVTGQVHTYRGANYLLPTMMRIAINRGNLGIDS
ncbi:MAG: hypothetical protein AAF823_00765 [Planctomycetota bacterium]